MAKTEVILTSSIVGVGAESDHVKVAAGYARNYLFPQRLAIPLTQANKRRIEVLKQRRGEREAHEFNTMSELAKGVAKLICIVKVKTGDDGKMFGAVTTGMIADELKHQFDISLDKRKIHIEHAIRTLGDQEVQLRLHPEVSSTLKVRVESQTPPPAPAEAPAAEGRRDERHDRRGRRGEADHGEPRRSGVRHEGTAEPAAPEQGAGAEKKPRAPRVERPPRAEKAGQPQIAPKVEKPARAPKSEKAE